mgnify:CR=1 FL=1
MAKRARIVAPTCDSSHLVAKDWHPADRPGKVTLHGTS